MENERRFSYALVLGMCVLISLILIAKMLFFEPVPAHRPHSTTQNAAVGQSSAASVTLTGAEVTALLRATMPADAPVTGLTLSFYENGEAEASGVLEKEKALSYLPGAARTLGLFLPARCEVRAAARIGSENGKIVLHLSALEAAGLQLPASLAGPLGEMLSEAANKALEEKGIRFRSLSVGKDALIFTP